MVKVIIGVILFNIVVMVGPREILASDNLDDIFKKAKISGYAKIVHIVHGKDNGFDPNSGSAMGGKLKLITNNYKGLKAGFACYTTGDTGLTDEDKEKLGHGLFLDRSLSQKTFVGEAYVEYTLSKSTIRFGRQKIDTPMTTARVNMVPSLYSAYTLTTSDLPDSRIFLSYIDKMAMGSRSCTEWFLIGEFTGTAGTVIRPMSPDFEKRGEFLPIEKMVGTTDETETDETNGITALGLVYEGIADTRLQLWDYLAHDIFNIIYAQADFTKKIKEITATFSLQMLHEREIGEKLANTGRDGTMWGSQAKFTWSKWGAWLAHNGSSKGKILNPWGGDPAFTSTIFSRNAYRADVNALKIGCMYKFMKKTALKLEYAHYGDSDTLGGNKTASLSPSADAYEWDIVLSYKPIKNLTLKIFNVIRKSEYDRHNRDKKQNHVRAIAMYKF